MRSRAHLRSLLRSLLLAVGLVAAVLPLSGCGGGAAEVGTPDANLRGTVQVHNFTTLHLARIDLLHSQGTTSVANVGVGGSAVYTGVMTGICRAWGYDQGGHQVGPGAAGVLVGDGGELSLILSN